jgi:heme/copper-type cytochrome/quinol oxidase subunit 2
MRLHQPHQPKDSDPPTPVTRRSLRFALLGGGSAWFAHLALAFTIAEFGCLAGLGHVQWTGLSVVAWMLLAMTAVTLAVGVAATWVAWRNRRRLLQSWGPRSESHEAEDFTARLALVTNATFVVVIVVQTIPIFYYLREC